jgi:ferritin-like metal-binding protein YciE
MAPKTPKEVFLLLLSNVRKNTERAAKIYEEIWKVAEEPEVKEILEARGFATKQIVAKIDECFRLIGEKPMDVPTHIHDMFLEDFRKEYKEIETPVAKRLYVFMKLRHLAHLRVGEYVALIEAADVAGHHGVGLLLETCLADKLAFIERTKRVVRKLVEQKFVEKVAIARA